MGCDDDTQKWVEHNDSSVHPTHRKPFDIGTIFLYKRTTEQIYKKARLARKRTEKKRKMKEFASRAVGKVGNVVNGVGIALESGVFFLDKVLGY